MDENWRFLDFENYIDENRELIDYLAKAHSLLDDYLSPLIKTLYYLINDKDKDGKVKPDNAELFEYGYQYLFENLEQMKLYLSGLNNDFGALERLSYYIKMIFDFEEFLVELNKEETAGSGKEQDIEKIHGALEYLEDLIVPEPQPEDALTAEYAAFYYDLQEKYPDIVLMSAAFEEYCAAYGI